MFNEIFHVKNYLQSPLPLKGAPEIGGALVNLYSESYNACVC